MAHMHSDRRDFLCTECPLTFKTSKSLKGHLLIHRARTHSCSKCGKLFNRQNNLRRHMRKMHNTEEGLPPPKTVRLLDVPPGMEFHKGSVAYYANKPKPLESHVRKPRRRKPKHPAPFLLEHSKGAEPDVPYTEEVLAAGPQGGVRYIDVSPDASETRRATGYLPVGGTSGELPATVPPLLGPYAPPLAVQPPQQQQRRQDRPQQQQQPSQPQPSPEGYTVPPVITHPQQCPVLPPGTIYQLPPAAHSGSSTQSRYLPRSDSQL